MITRIFAILTAFLSLYLLLGCSKSVTEESIVGYWRVSPETVEAMLREKAGDAEINEEEFGKQIARHFLNKMVIGFDGSESTQYRGGKPGKPTPYTVLSVEDGIVTINISDQVELSIHATQDSLSFAPPGSKQELKWLRMNQDEIEKLKEAIERSENGPGASAPVEQRFMWLINAPLDKAQNYLNKFPELLEARTEQQQQTFLHYTARFKKIELAKLALAAGADVDAVDDSGDTALLLATTFDINEAFVQLLLDAGANIDHQDKRGATTLADAVHREKVEKVRTLLNLGADVDAGVEIGEKTPLFVAIEDEQTELVKILLEADADIHHTVFDSKDGALYVAARYGTLETIQLLLDKGMDPNAGNANEWKPINNITFRDKEKIEAVQLLVNAGADINERGAGGRTLLSSAIRSKDAKFAKDLVEAGADFEMVTSFDKTHYDEAKEAGLSALVELMNRKLEERSK